MCFPLKSRLNVSRADLASSRDAELRGAAHTLSRCAGARRLHFLFRAERSYPLVQGGFAVSNDANRRRQEANHRFESGR